MAKAKTVSTDTAAEFLDTLNELNKVANRTNLAGVQPKAMVKRTGGSPTKRAATKGTAVETTDVCGVYGKARPILELIVKLPFIPAKAKEIVRTLMSVLDLVCPR